MEIAHLVVQSQEIQTKYDIMSDRLEGKVNQDEVYIMFCLHNMYT